MQGLKKRKFFWFSTHLFVPLQQKACEAAHARPSMQASWLSLNRSFVTVITKRKKIMSIDTYKLTSMEDPTDEVLSQLMREAAEEAKQKRAEATTRFFGQLKRESEKIAASC